MGVHDTVAIVESPSDEVMAKFVLSLAGLGAVRPTTLKAFDEQEYRKTISSLGWRRGGK